MATSRDSLSAMTEHCERCDRPTSHEIQVRILREAERGENAAFSREPYRISECTACGLETRTRMNNA